MVNARWLVTAIGRHGCHSRRRRVVVLGVKGNSTFLPSASWYNSNTSRRARTRLARCWLGMSKGMSHVIQTLGCLRLSDPGYAPARKSVHSRRTNVGVLKEVVHSGAQSTGSCVRAREPSSSLGGPYPSSKQS